MLFDAIRTHVLMLSDSCFDAAISCFDAIISHVLMLLDHHVLMQLDLMC